jgi:hypothetical protein
VGAIFKGSSQGGTGLAGHRDVHCLTMWLMRERGEGTHHFAAMPARSPYTIASCASNSSARDQGEHEPQGKGGERGPTFGIKTTRWLVSVWGTTEAQSL